MQQSQARVLAVTDVTHEAPRQRRREAECAADDAELNASEEYKKRRDAVSAANEAVLKATETIDKLKQQHEAAAANAEQKRKAQLTDKLKQMSDGQARIQIHVPNADTSRDQDIERHYWASFYGNESNNHVLAVGTQVVMYQGGEADAGVLLPYKRTAGIIASNVDGFAADGSCTRVQHISTPQMRPTVICPL